MNGLLTILRATTGLRGLAFAGSAAFIALASTPAAAQVQGEVVLNIMRECAKIDDPTARLACYDNNIRSAGAAPARNSVPGRMDTPQGGGAAAAPSSGAQGFGADDVRSPDRFNPSGPTETRAEVARIREREPGVYLVTLADGAEWLFAESVDRNFRAPRRGSSVEIRRGSLGSYLMRFDDQISVRVRRVQ